MSNLALESPLEIIMAMQDGAGLWVSQKSECASLVEADTDRVVYRPVFIAMLRQGVIEPHATAKHLTRYRLTPKGQSIHK